MKRRLPKYITKEYVERILSNHYGQKVTVSACMKEDVSRWSGQVWDDGPLPEVLVGLNIKRRKTK